MLAFTVERFPLGRAVHRRYDTQVTWGISLRMFNNLPFSDVSYTYFSLLFGMLFIV